MPAPNPQPQKAETATAAPKGTAPTFEPIAHTLKYPVQDGSETVTVITITRRLKARDMVNSAGLAPENPAKQEIYSLSAITGVNADVLEEMDGWDYTRVMETARGFLAE